MSFKVGVLSISDTAHADASTDRSGPILRDQLSQTEFVGSITRDVCPDEVDQIRARVKRMIDEDGLDLVITSGGTGFGLRDVTPEAIESLITRKTPALTHALTAFSLSKTPLAALSRGVTGIRKREAGGGGGGGERESLIVALPGSPKAVKECLEVLLGGASNGLLKHALELLSGGRGETKHKEMQGGLHRTIDISTATDTGCSHHHHHHHSHHGGGGGGGLHSHRAPKPRTTAADHTGYRTIDPTSGPSLRHRVSPHPLLDLDHALDLIAQHTPSATAIQTLPVNTSLIGYVLAEDVTALSDLPPGPTTNVDGYAVNAKATPAGEYKVVTLSTLQNNRSLQPGEIFRINTGQGLPSGTDAVVMVEDTELLSSQPNGEEEVVKVLAQVDVGENVRPKASDVKQGQVVLRVGTTITALGGEIGTLAFLGRSEVKVYRKPKIAILSTGNELVDPAPLRSSSTSSTPTTATANSQTGSDPSSSNWGFNVFDANRPGLKAAITGYGYEIVDLGIVSDSIDQTLTALKKGIAEADVIITTGGTSMGESDLLKPLIERQLNGTIHFGRVAMKPGKPTTFATLPTIAAQTQTQTQKGDEKPQAELGKIIFALPGNPASALVTFYIFVLPALRKLSGQPASSSPSGLEGRRENWNLPQIPVVLGDGEAMRLDPRPEFHRAVVRLDRASGQLKAYSTGNQRSSGMHSMSTLNALIALPALPSPQQQQGAEQGGASKTWLKAGAKVNAVLLGPIV